MFDFFLYFGFLNRICISFLSLLLTLDSWLMDHDPWPMTHDSLLFTLYSWLLTLDSWLLTLDSWLLTLDSWLLTLDFWLLTLDFLPDMRSFHQSVFSFVWQGCSNRLRWWFQLSNKVVPIVRQNLDIWAIGTTLSGK